jgi:hypothetical protein
MVALVKGVDGIERSAHNSSYVATPRNQIRYRGCLAPDLWQQGSAFHLFGLRVYFGFFT